MEELVKKNDCTAISIAKSAIAPRYWSDLEKLHSYNLQIAMVRDHLPRLDMTKNGVLEMLSAYREMQKMNVQNSFNGVLLKNELIKGLLWYAYTCTFNLAKRWYSEKEDMLTLAYIALENVIEKKAFDPNRKGANLAVYLKKAVFRAISKGVMDTIRAGLVDCPNLLNKANNAKTMAKAILKGKTFDLPFMIENETENEDGDTISFTDNIADDTPNPYEQMEMDEKEKYLNALVEDILTDTEKKIYRLREKGVKFSAIGEELGITEDACKMRFDTIKHKIRSAWNYGNE